LIDILVF